MDERQATQDDVLQQFRQETAAKRRGRLKIFFGYAAGVGKTYSMLEATRNLATSGADIAVGYVEPHSRPETEALLLGLEVLPPKKVEHRGIHIQEFDLDAALARKPTTLVVDELAHTNAPGSRHAKRWQDIAELLDAGVNVFTTLNVQHVESLNDVVARISGIQVRETIPDLIFDKADSIELVDLPPEELLERFHEGKVYVPAKREQAMANFFKLPNLIALRELALRRTADRVSAQAETAPTETGGSQVWTTTERLLVCVGPSPTSARIIRAAKRMAASLRAPWIATYVDSGQLSDAAREKLTLNLRLAEQLGAEPVTIGGENVAQTIVNYAHARRVTKIVIGKTGQPRWRELFGRSVVSKLLRLSGDIDIYVIRGKEEPDDQLPLRPARSGPAYDRRAWLICVLTVLACTALGGLVQWAFLARFGNPISPAGEGAGPSVRPGEIAIHINQAMAYLLGVAFVAARCGRWPGIWASVASVLLFDFLFIPPQLTFVVYDTQYFITFAVMLVIAVLISTLTDRIRRQGEAARHRERQTRSLYRLSRKLAGTSGRHQLVATAENELSESLASEVAVFLPDAAGRLQPSVGGPASFTNNPRELAVAQWVFDHGQLAGTGTDTLPQANALYLPVVGPRGPVGVLGIRSLELSRFSAPDERHLLETLAGQIALAVERDRLAEESQRILMQAETERLRSSLLSSVSHDLRTPLAVVLGASTSLLDGGSRFNDEVRRELLQTIVDESSRLSRLVENLLNITRLEDGRAELTRQWNSIEEIVGSALARVKQQLGEHAVRTQLPRDLPLVQLDGVLIEQVLINLLENAAKYTPAASPIDISARVQDRGVIVEVADRGPGLSADERQRVFDKFYRGSAAAGASQRGAGLGLAICQAIVAAHSGRIWVENRPDGGARFLFSIPMEGQPPEVNMDAAPDAAES